MSEKKEMWMDDVSDITVAGHETVEAKLAEFGIHLTPQQSDGLYDSIWLFVEQFSNGNYRREM
jgi:hypothetical protein